MKTFYAPGDLESPTVITLARDEGTARTKIAEALIAKGEPDPRNFIDFTVIEVEDDEPVVIDAEDSYI